MDRKIWRFKEGKWKPEIDVWGSCIQIIEKPRDRRVVQKMPQSGSQQQAEIRPGSAERRSDGIDQKSTHTESR